MENRIAIEPLLALVNGTVDISSTAPDYVQFPLRGTAWELIHCSVGRMSRQARKLIGAHLQVLEAEIYNEVILPFTIPQPTCFLYIQLRGMVSFHDQQNQYISGSDCPCVSLCYYPAGDYLIRYAAGFHSFFIVSFEEEWPFSLEETYPAFGKLIKAWLGKADHSCRLPPMPISKPIANLLDELRLIAVKWMQDSVRILHLLGKIIYAYHEQLEASQGTREWNVEQQRQLLDEYLGKHYRDEQACAIPCIKKFLGLSRNGLEKLTADSLGCTLRRYVVEFRIGKACQLLSETNLKILDIACQSGFADLAHFTKSFKRSMGMYPSAYRKKSS